jgi:hypothetical protein
MPGLRDVDVGEWRIKACMSGRMLINSEWPTSTRRSGRSTVAESESSGGELPFRQIVSTRYPHHHSVLLLRNAFHTFSLRRSANNTAE